MYGTRRTELLLIRCRVCGVWVAVRVDPDDVARHTNGMYVQQAFCDRTDTPYLAAAERELLITKCCGSCWDLLCPDPITYPTAYN